MERLTRGPTVWRSRSRCLDSSQQLAVSIQSLSILNEPQRKRRAQKSNKKSKTFMERSRPRLRGCLSFTDGVAGTGLDLPGNRSAIICGGEQHFCFYTFLPKYLL